ncbi:hypothetical protein CERSUDRAFT_115830 [Gelatoporia subvermispora B]|uniref:Uncharacterized protein n=1 Tax=Ceriporiopsis subvermispora (strain B) TaxID=914234 RepID=M2QFX3_CERS8|nr:hypothetical protein CERSUDRAFT_115830 [Gelatoporia subvermispora B]
MVTPVQRTVCRGNGTVPEPQQECKRKVRLVITRGDFGRFQQYLRYGYLLQSRHLSTSAGAAEAERLDTVLKETDAQKVTLKTWYSTTPDSDDSDEEDGSDEDDVIDETEFARGALRKLLRALSRINEVDVHFQLGSREEWETVFGFSG